MGMDPDDVKRAFVHEPWHGDSGEVSLHVRHDAKNYCVAFVMPVEEN